jgi:ATP-binding protein involved in chromosome partitioning
LDYLIIDLPPGTGDIHMTLAQQFPLTGAVIVTTPQQVAVADARKCIEMFRNPALNTPLLGVVENMSYFTPMEMPTAKYRIFGEGGGRQLASEYGMTLLAELPLFGSLASQADMGRPAVLSEDSLLQTDFIHMAEKVAQQLSIINGVGPGKV